jgi:hypothetical protein
MKQTSRPAKEPAEVVVKDIRRATRRHFSAEKKIRIVLEGLRGEESIAELCRRARRAGMPTRLVSSSRWAGLRVLSGSGLILCRRRHKVSLPSNLIRLASDLDHWTVLRRVTSRSLTFFDSSGCARVSLANCRSTAERSRGARRVHIIEPKGIFLVWGKPSWSGGSGSV